MTEETIGIVMALLSRAKAGEVQWILGQDENEFVVNLPEFSVTVTKGFAVRAYFKFSVHDSNGNALISEMLVDQGKAEYALVSELHELARLSALKVPEKLKSLKDQLKKPGIIGSTG